MSIETLLEPSLGEKPVVRPYSVRACFLVTFFGGAIAGAMFGALNSRRMGRLAQDIWLFFPVALLWTCAIAWAGWMSAADSWPEWIMVMGSASRTMRYLSRLLGFFALGIFYVFRRNIWRAAEFAGEAPSPWKAALSVLLASAVLTALAFALGYTAQSIHGG